MKKEQKKIVLIWLLAVLFIVAHAVFDDWIRRNHEITDLPVFMSIVGILWYAGRRAKPGPDFTLDKIIEKYRWIKVYIMAYSMFFTSGINYVLSNKIVLVHHVSFIWLVLAILMLAFPAVVIHQIKAYERAADLSSQ